MKLIKSLLLVLFATTTILGQRLEIGGSAGLLPYRGDYQQTFNIFVPNPGVGVFTRYNFNNGISLKAYGTTGLTSGKDSRSSDPLNQFRGNEFNAWLIEGGGQLEFNFLDFRSTRALQKRDYTPYLFVGWSIWNMPTVSSIRNTHPDQPNISQSFVKKGGNALPFGLGFKKVWKSNWNIGFEFGARKLYDDEFDLFGYKGDGTSLNESANSKNPQVQKVGIPNNHLRDMYYYVNFNVSYVFYKVHCPNPR